jgi:uncharacterized membrane protein YkoI
LAYTGEKLAKVAKVSIAEARAIALKAHPGKITDEELERETGGSGLRYSFDIKSETTQEVGVDAKTGRVLENAQERNMSVFNRRDCWASCLCRREGATVHPVPTG